MVRQGSLERDLVWLRALSWRFRDQPSAPERRELLQRVMSDWPAQASATLRLAALAHGLDEGLDERLAGAPRRLTELSTRDPWDVEPEDARTVRLAGLVRAEQVDYATFVPGRDTPMVLRDALTEPDDMASIAAMVRWETLMRMSVSTPERLLSSWHIHASSLARDARTWDPGEYENTLDIRSHLQRFAAVLSWAGQAQWREHIEPADETFRACTERREEPLALAPDVRPDGWWRYRLPLGVSDTFRELATRDVAPGRYVTGPIGPGRHGCLRTTSFVWELAERPDGLRAMTDQELRYWSRFCRRQAEAEAAGQTRSTDWRERDERAQDERERRAAR